MTDQHPLVSIVVSAYNHAAFLPATLDSIEAQTYDPIEVVIVDDGSTDGTGALADAYAKRSRHRVKVVHQANAGMVKAIARGFRESSGELVGFFDSDDVMHADKTARQVRELREHDVDAVLGNFTWLAADGKTYPYPNAPEFTDRWDAEAFIEGLVCSWGPMFTGALFRRSLLEAIGGPDQGLPMNDWPFLVKAARAARRMRVTREPVFYYRQHPRSHHTHRMLELLEWKMRTVTALCSPRVARKARARAYRLVAEGYLEAVRPLRALGWYLRSQTKGPQPDWRLFYRIVGQQVKARLLGRAWKPAYSGYAAGPPPPGGAA
ncbi:MAG: hypothetical protein QOI63_1101 [Thermoplasmata archaeon]|jgi:hypothetical protein|nr:hypothetical protein [Thermoplasmata archaeon]